MADKEKKKKESILDLSKYIDKTIRVKFQGGREGPFQPQAATGRPRSNPRASAEGPRRGHVAWDFLPQKPHNASDCGASWSVPTPGLTLLVNKTGRGSPLCLGSDKDMDMKRRGSYTRGKLRRGGVLGFVGCWLELGNPSGIQPYCPGCVCRNKSGPPTFLISLAASTGQGLDLLLNKGLPMRK
ncbi:PREDICTED: U6 snRNA-associated Sm-like protein LSm7 isoform X2 [Galeopterus variegatus]|uniref:U6 snRNA-associated Sm-like protein LSm7 isoform X2 n=1 Tax=Galeopterus variegatus TaxID=482537 RepID=A0ABM0REJ0_GALVR|nr:PREDICTED: U6 snRNA-associated Sm-like protein LSm7 isoform X2 [Galeopterus variegatus]